MPLIAQVVASMPCSPVCDVSGTSLNYPPVVADESGSLPAAAALALTLHHLTGGKTSQSRIKQQSRYYFASAHAASCSLVDLVSVCCHTTQVTDKYFVE